MDCSHLNKSVSAGTHNDDQDDDIQFVGEKVSSENWSHPQQSGGTGEQDHRSTTTKFQCQICKESLTSYANLHTHLKNVHNATIKLTCNLCGKTFNENRKLIAHVEDHKTKRSNFSETKSKSKRKKSVSNSKSKAKRSKRTRKNKNKADKSTSFTKRKRQRGDASKELAKKKKIDEATEITDSDKTNVGSVDTPSTEISIFNGASSPPPSPSPVSPQNPTGEDDWGWDTDPQLPQPELSTTLELQPPPDSSSLSVPVITTSPKSSSDADLPENSVFEDYFEPMSPKLEVFDDVDLEEDLFASHSGVPSSFPRNLSENLSSFPFQCSKCDLQFRTSDLLQIHQSFHNLLIQVNFRCEVPSCFQYFDDAVEYQRHFTSSHTNKRNRRSAKRLCNGRQRKTTISCNYCSKKSRTKSEAILHDATHSKMLLEDPKKSNPEEMQKPQKINFADEESDLEDPAEDPLMLIESVPESDVESVVEMTPDPERVLPGDAMELHSNSGDFNSGEESTTKPILESIVESKEQRGIDLLPCPSCSQKFTTKCLLESHLKSDHVDVHPVEETGTGNLANSLSCPQCPTKVFASKTKLQRHLAYHRKIPRHVCPICGWKFKDGTTCKVHIKRHRAERNFTCPVPECAMAFTTAGEQQNHTKRHRPGEPHVHKWIRKPKSLEAPKTGFCSFCNSQFDTENELAEHKAANHTESRLFPCPKCGKSFKVRKNMGMHLKVVHATVKPFSCPFCDNKFAVKSYLNKHVVNHHTHLCPICGKAHQSKARLEEHVQTHSGDPKSFCSICSRQFDSESELAEHKAAHHTKSRSFPCPKCGKSFKATKNLGAHLKEVHATVKPFSCHLCVDKHFPSKPRLDKHLLSHPEHHNAHRCPICGKGHLTKTSLNQHIETHTADPWRFPCPVPNCSKAYATPSQLRRHTRDHPPPQSPGNGDGLPPTNKCEVCNKLFFNEFTFLRHSKRMHGPKHPNDNSSPEAFACDLCEVSFLKRISWARHKLKHDSNTDNLCNMCGRLFPTPEALDAHKKITHKHRKDPEAKGERIICDVCGKSVGRWKLKVHMDRHSEVPLICDVCAKPCKTEADLKLHKNTHLSEKPLKCKFCPYRYNQPTSIYSHMQHHHTGVAGSGFVESPLTSDLERNFPCDVDECSQSFSSLPCLKQHQLYHTADKVSRCNKCAEKFVTKWDVYIHKQEVHKKRFECEYCKKICVNAPMLESHIRYNHTLEEPFPCKAPGCGRKFKGKSDLRYHTVVAHTGEYKFECEVCGKKFATRGNLNTHMRVHMATKDFRCEEEGCEASFKAASLLHKHLLKDHGRTDLPGAFSRHGKRIQPMNIS